MIHNNDRDPAIRLTQAKLAAAVIGSRELQIKLGSTAPGTIVQRVVHVHIAIQTERTFTLRTAIARRLR